MARHVIPADQPAEHTPAACCPCCPSAARGDRGDGTHGWLYLHHPITDAARQEDNDYAAARRGYRVAAATGR